ncbi:MAG: exodeoxyribonuclease VII small subunit [Acidobacteria bacterium 13_1_20CM_3_53_8]|nr:MAG: exodeoxyribonuclease VII small subunit [Acidobacteria bacterium 13_1_20CM_3_53_8]
MKRRETRADSFESQLSALEKIVRELERGDLPLEDSLKLFEEGVRLSRECQERLNQAERKIETLLRDADGRPLLGSLEDEEEELRLTEEIEQDESIF